MRWSGKAQRRSWRTAVRRGWIARAEDPRTSGAVRDELQAICERRDAGIS